MREIHFDSLLTSDSFAFENDKDFINDWMTYANDDSHDNGGTTSDSSNSGSFRDVKKSNKRGKYNTGPKLKNVEDKNMREMWLQQQELARHIPSLVKSDIRRSYSNLFTNVVNRMDFSLLFEFLKQYCAPNLVHIQNFSVNVKGQIFPGPGTAEQMMQLQKEPGCEYAFKTAHLIGLQNVAQFWYNKIQVMPDSVYQLNSAQVHTTSSSSESKVVSDFSAAFTKLYDLPFHIAIPGQAVVDHTSSGWSEVTTFKSEPTDSAASTNTTPTTTTTSITSNRKRPLSTTASSAKVEISDAISNHMTAANMFPVPIPLRSKVLLVMHLNSNMLIERMEYVTHMEKDLTHMEKAL